MSINFWKKSKIMRYKKQLLSGFLAVIMTVSLFPPVALSENNEVSLPSSTTEFSEEAEYTPARIDSSKTQEEEVEETIAAEENVHLYTAEEIGLIEEYNYLLGDPRPQAEDFVKTWDGPVEISPSLEEIDWDHTGTIDLSITIEDQIFFSKLILYITKESIGLVEEYKYLIGDPQPEVDDFVHSWDGPIEISPALEEIDWDHTGTVDLSITIEGQVFSSKLILYITKESIGLVEEYKYLIGEPRPEAEDFVYFWNDPIEISPALEEVDWNHTGTTDLTITIDGQIFLSRLIIDFTSESIGLVEEYNYNIGDPHPTFKDLVKTWDGQIKSSPRLDNINWEKIGTIEITFIIEDRKFISHIHIDDVNAPELEVASAAVLLKSKSEVTPEDFIIYYYDETNVVFYFEKDPEVKTRGEKKVTIIAEDEGGNITKRKTTLLVCDYLLEMELSKEKYTGLELRELVKKEMHGYYPSTDPYQKKFSIDEVGVKSFTLTKDNKDYLVGVQIRDTQKPSGEAVDRICCLGYVYKPEDFVKNVKDFQPVTISFLKEPDWNTPGERIVSVVLTDTSYNTRIVRSSVEFKKDDIPPEIVPDGITRYYVGSAITYTKAVTVTDNIDPDVTLTIDKSQVRYRKPGTYPVIYTATDRDGNSSTVTVEFEIFEPKHSQEELDKLADEVFKKVLTDDMSVAEEIKAIYYYVRRNIRYKNFSDKSDWMGEAYRGLTELKGDCFTYYSVAYLLLSKIDCDILSVERIGGATHHYWLLVNIGTGWYHYDCCPNHVFGTCFMRTNEQLHVGDGVAYWKYDEDAYPAVATKPFKMPE